MNSNALLCYCEPCAQRVNGEIQFHFNLQFFLYITYGIVIVWYNTHVFWVVTLRLGFLYASYAASVPRCRDADFEFERTSDIFERLGHVLMMVDSSLILWDND